MDGITKEEMKIAEQNIHWSCYMGSATTPFHEIGCPHVEWTTEQLQGALEVQKAVVRVLQHKLFGTPLDGKPVAVYTEYEGDKCESSEVVVKP